MSPTQCLDSGCQISEWLNKIQPGCALGITTAFDEVGIECVQDLFSIDEEVFEALESALRSVGAQAPQINKVKKAIQATLAICSSKAPRSALPSVPEEEEERDEPAVYIGFPRKAGVALRKELRPSEVGNEQDLHLPEYTPTSIPPLNSRVETAEIFYSVAADKQPCWTVRRKAAVARRRLLGKIWQLSQDKTGCIEVQELLESSNENTCKLIAFGLRGKVCEAALCRHANHVLRKCISLLKTTDMQFMIDEIGCRGPSMILEIARHRFGCRVLEVLLVSCKPGQLNDIIECILSNTVSLSQHMFGNFVIQALLEQGTNNHCQDLLTKLVCNISTVGKNFYGLAVLLNVLHQKSAKEQRAIASALMAAPGLLEAIMVFKRGPTVVQLALDVLDEPEQEATQHQLQQR